MKKKYLTGILAGVVLCSSLTLFACGTDDKNKDLVYDKANQIVSTMKSSEGLFKSGTIYDVKTDFIFSSFKYDSDSFYNGLFAIPMNYISSHYQILSDLKGRKDLTSENIELIDNLDASLTELNNAYTVVYQQYERLEAFTSNDQTHDIIYEGALQLFRYDTTDIIGKAYEVAIDLSEIEESIFKVYSGMITSDNLTTADTAEIRDYLSIYVGYDYYSLLLKNCQSYDLTDDISFLGNVENNFKNYLQNVVAIEETSLNSLFGGAVGGGTSIYNNVAITELLNVNNKMMEERKSLQTALSEYSYYDNFLNPKDQTQTENDFTQVHVHEIEQYFNLYMIEHTNYIKSIIVKG